MRLRGAVPSPADRGSERVSLTVSGIPFIATTRNVNRSPGSSPVTLIVSAFTTTTASVLFHWPRSDQQSRTTYVSLLRTSYVCLGLVKPDLGGWIVKWVASSSRVPKDPSSIPGGAKVLGTDGMCKYLPVSVSSYVAVCLCLLCSVCID